MKKYLISIEKARKNLKFSNTFLYNVAIEKRRILREFNTFSYYISNNKQDNLIINNERIVVCLVTEELAGIHPSGGIGAAFLELARALTKAGIIVDILYCSPVYFNNKDSLSDISSKVYGCCRDIFLLDPSIYTTQDFTPNKVSYAIYRWLKDRDGIYSHIHFHDYKGLGYYSLLARKQLTSFLFTEMVVQVHGPTRWALGANNQFFSHKEQLRFDYMEKLSLELSDYIVAPSAYILEWIDSNKFSYLNRDKCFVIKNCLPEIGHSVGYGVVKNDNTKTIIYFGRHEQRKGLKIFCDALRDLNNLLKEMAIRVVFLGGMGNVSEMPSLLYLDGESKYWSFDFDIKTDLLRDEALFFIRNSNNPVVCIASPYENSPYAVAEVMQIGIPIISSLQGGGKELFADQEYPGLINMNPKDLANALRLFINSPQKPPLPHQSPESISNDWIRFHEGYNLCKASVNFTYIKSKSNYPLPLVSVIITHHDRPEKLMEAAISIMLQTYPNIEIVIVDDGSKKKSTLEIIEKSLTPLLKIFNGRIIFQENLYLGAARNKGIDNSTGDYICFLDDDDIAMPNMIDDLLLGIISSNADVLIALNSYMPILERNVIKSLDVDDLRISYLPTAGPYSLAAIENCIGGATSLFRVDVLKDVGGYSELFGIGHEDYELYTKLIGSNKNIMICPSAVYLYEVGRPSMLSNTGISQNFMRNFNALICDLRMKDLINLFIGQDINNGMKSRISWIMSHKNNNDLARVLEFWPNRNKSIENYLLLLESEGRDNSMYYLALKNDLTNSK